AEAAATATTLSNSTIEDFETSQFTRRNSNQYATRHMGRRPTNSPMGHGHSVRLGDRSCEERRATTLSYPLIAPTHSSPLNQTASRADMSPEAVHPTTVADLNVTGDGTWSS
ncbi:hypothetical protein GWI33_009012, partial [Rhynchophorus ferrugineus]